MSPEQGPEQSHTVLTAEQIAQLEAGPGLVTHSAGPLLAPVSELDHLNNFSAFFYDSNHGSFIARIYHQRPCYQRFRIVYPQLTAQLEAEVVNGYASVADYDFMSHDTGKLFATAYELMRDLVDLSDDDVVENDEFNPYILWS